MRRRTFLKILALSSALASTFRSPAAAVMPVPGPGKLVVKKSFSLDRFAFELGGRHLPVRVGYETYGTLNAAKDNAVLICHYFAGSGHAAGRYQETDPAPGWWDSLIGPGKAIDTDRFFVISSDVLCNLNANNPNVITTGPATVNPETGRPYALDFPLLTLRDIVGVQRELVQSLGIRKLRAVSGPSLGGLQAFAWARYFPEMVESIIPVISLPMIRPMMLMNPGQLAIDAIELDPNWNHGNYYGGPAPNEGLLLAFKILLMAAKSDQNLEAAYGRDIADSSHSPYEFFDGQFKVDKTTEDLLTGRLHTLDANAYIYLSKAVTLFDLRKPGQSLEDALGEMHTRTLLINDASDLMFGARQSEMAAQMLGNAELFQYDSGNGHLSGLYQTELFAPKIAEFLR